MEDVDEVNHPDSDWVVTNVRTAYSKYVTTASLMVLLNFQDIVEPSNPDDVFSLRRCMPSNIVFHGQGLLPANFFFIYVCVMKDSCVRIPFDDFCTDVLHTLNVAPTQLHPNSWMYVRAFQILCVALDLTPIVPLFLHHYLTQQDKKIGWLSLVSQPGNHLFNPYSSSYKHFEDTFIKISFGSGGRELNTTGMSRSSPYTGPGHLFGLHLGCGWNYQQKICRRCRSLIASLRVSLPDKSSTPSGVKIRTVSCLVRFSFVFGFLLHGVC